MSGEDYGAERGEGEEDDAEGGVDQAEESRPDAVGYEANGDDQQGEPGHQAGGNHQDSPPGRFGAEDGMGEREPVGGDADPVNHGCGVEDGQANGGGDIGGQMLRDGAFVSVLAGAGVGPQRFLDGVEKRVEPQRKQDDYADGLEDGPNSRVGQVGENIVAAQEDQGEEDQVASDGADATGDSVAPTADNPAADGQHVDGAHRRRRCQSHEIGGRKHVDVRDQSHVSADG